MASGAIRNRKLVVGVPGMTRDLYPHQDRALDLLRYSLGSGKRRPMLMLPTGAGKTVVAAAIIEGAQRKGNRAVFCVPAIELVDQTVQRFWEEGITEVGVIQADHPMTNPSRPVQVASIQTLQRRDVPEAAIVIVDEAHRTFDVVRKWAKRPEWARVPFIGLSATPWTAGLGKIYDDLIIAATTEDLIRAGFLSPFRVFAPSHPDLSGVRTQAGDYHEGDLGEAMDKVPLVADVVTTWLQRGEGRPTLCFAVNRAHARHLEERFRAAGVSAAYVDAYTPRIERDAIRDQFHDGRIQVVCNVGVLTTGVDWDVRCIILARATKSEMLFVQMIGRGLRTAEGKQDCLVLDHSDTTLRLGFVTDIYHDSLDMGRERGKAKEVEAKPRLPKECPHCSFLKPAGARVCPACGFKAERQSNVEVEDGELFELRTSRKPKVTAREMTGSEKATLYGELKWIARERGYSPGWCSHKFKEKAGVWPNHYHDQPEVKPSLATLSWVKSRQIAFSKRRAA